MGCSLPVSGSTIREDHLLPRLIFARLLADVLVIRCPESFSYFNRCDDDDDDDDDRRADSRELVGTGMNTMGGLSMNDERKQLQSIDPSNLEDWLSQASF